MKLQDDIPLTIYFEIGNTKKKIEDLLHITKGTLYRLENSTKNTVRLMLENEDWNREDFDEEWKNVR